MNYKYTTLENRSVFIIEDDGSCKTSLLITNADEANTDYQAFLKYQAEGGVVLPADDNEQTA